MHLYQNGMDLTLIGHAQLKTTHVYAYANTEHKRNVFAKFDKRFRFAVISDINCFCSDLHTKRLRALIKFLAAVVFLHIILLDRTEQPVSSIIKLILHAQGMGTPQTIAALFL